MYRMVLWIFGGVLLAVVTDFLIAPWMLSCTKLEDNGSVDTLILLHVLFRHGDRGPDPHEVYPKDPHALHGFAKVGYGQLTKNGKQKEYQIGKALRNKYNQFLGQYNPDKVVAKSTDYIRTRMSCELVLAGLYPPDTEQLWEEGLLWQPIPCDYEAYPTDRVLGDPLVHCPPFKSFYKQFLNSFEGKAFYRNNKEIYDFLSENTGWNVKTPRPIYDLYFLLKSEEVMGLQLPEWTKSLWPENITTLGADEYSAQTSSTNTLRIAAGYLIEKILKDTDLTLADQGPHSRKIYLYSAHEYNIAFILKALGAFEPHIPPFGSYVTLEVHNIEGIYGFKIFYQDYESSSSEPKLLKLKNCDEFCPIEKFKQLMEKYIPLPHQCDER